MRQVEVGETGGGGWDRGRWVDREIWVGQGEMGGIGRYGWDRELWVGQGDAGGTGGGQAPKRQG